MSEHRFKHKYYTMACKMLQYYIPDIVIQYKNIDSIKIIIILQRFTCHTVPRLEFIFYVCCISKLEKMAWFNYNSGTLFCYALVSILLRVTYITRTLKTP